MAALVGGLEQATGPSWARANWPPLEPDALNAGLDPTQSTIETARRAGEGRAAARAGAARPGRRSSRPRSDTICAMMLIRTYRVRGHLAADLDPLGLVQARACRTI